MKTRLLAFVDHTGYLVTRLKRRHFSVAYFTASVTWQTYRDAQTHCPKMLVSYSAWDAEMLPIWSGIYCMPWLGSWCLLNFWRLLLHLPRWFCGGQLAVTCSECGARSWRWTASLSSERRGTIYITYANVHCLSQNELIIDIVQRLSIIISLSWCVYESLSISKYHHYLSISNYSFISVYMYLYIHISYIRICIY